MNTQRAFHSNESWRVILIGHRAPYHVLLLNRLVIAVSYFNQHCLVTICEEKGVYRVLVGKPEGRRPMGRPRRRWVDNIRMNLQEVGCGYMDWIGLAQDRDRWRTLVSAVMNLWVP